MGLASSGLAMGGGLASIAAIALGVAAVAPWRTSGLVRVDDVVVSAVAALGAVVCTWLALSCVLGAVCVLGRLVGNGWRGGEAAVRRWAPDVVRRAVAATIGGGIALGLAATGASAAPDAPAVLGAAVTSAAFVEAPTADAPPLAWTVTAPDPGANDGAGDDGSDDGTDDGTDDETDDGTDDETDDETDHDRHGEARRDRDRAHDDVRTPTRDTAPRAQVPVTDHGGNGHGGSPDAGEPRTVVVRSGDSLWTIAAAALGPSASAAEVAEAWPAWYEENRDVIGADPDLVQVGQVLVTPRAAR